MNFYCAVGFLGTGLGTSTLAGKLEISGIILGENGQRVCTSGNSICALGGSGTVSNGIANRLAFYASAGNSIDSVNFLATDITNSRFGVATATPFGKLHVSASTTPNLVLSDTGAGVDLKHWYASSTGGALVFGTLNDALSTLTERIRYSSGGYLGIASSTPWGLLSINPNALGSGVPEFVVGSSTATRLIVDGSGKVGIGTTQPSARLEIVNTSSGATADQLY